MKRMWRVSLMVLVVLVLGVSSALAAQISLGAKVIYGGFTMFADESERYGTSFPLYALDGSLKLDSGLKFSAEWITGNSGWVEMDTLGYDRDSSSYSPYVFSSLKADVAWPVADGVSLLVGVTKWKAALDWSNDPVDHDWYPVVGSGFKLGFDTAFAISEKLTASVKYAYLPYVYAIEEPQDFDDYEWLGTGHELEAKAAYAFSDRFAIEGGYKADSYAGWTSCCEYPADEAYAGFFAGAKYTF